MCSPLLSILDRFTNIINKQKIINYSELELGFTEKKHVLFSAILVMYLTQRLDFSRDTATVLFHSFTALCYIMPLFGAILADSYFGRYK